MELKFEKLPCRCIRELMREVQNLEQTQELRLPDGMPDIGRVIGVWGQVVLRSKEWRGDGIGAAGGVMAWVLYGPDDGTEPQCIDIWLPFQGKWSFPETDQEGVIRINPVLRSVDARIVSGRKLMVRANIGIWAEALIPCEPDVYVPGEMPEGVELLRHTYPVRLPKEAKEKTFMLDEELTLPGSCPKVEKVLRFEMVPQLVDSRVMAGKVVFRGNGLLHILYWGDDGKLHTWDFEIPFSQFAELEEEFGSDADANILLVTTNLELDKMEDGSLRLKCGLVAQALITDQILLELAEDAYSPTREVVATFCQAMLPAVLDDRGEQLTVELQIETDCRNILDVLFMPDHPVVNRLADHVKTVQAGTVQVLYEDSAGGVQSIVRRWEKDMDIEASDDCDVAVVLQQFTAPSALAGDGQLNLKGNVKLSTRTESSRGLQMISALELGEMKKADPNRPSVILRRTEGKRLWDLAKECGTTVLTICQTNGLTEEPDPGRMLLIPVM